MKTDSYLDGNPKGEQLNVKRALQLLNTEMKTKYPPGSFIVFSAKYKKGEKPGIVSCSWYDKIGGKHPLKNIVSKPPEWQNIPWKKAQEICEMFDKHLFANMVFV